MWSCSERGVRRAAVLLLGLIAGSLLLVRPATAHAELIGSDPVAGAVLTQAPRSAVLRFSEEIAPRFSSARLVDGSGRPVAGVRSGSGTRALTLRLPPLGPGSYGVVWRVLAEDDGHTTSGVVVFAVGRTTDGARSDAAGPGTLGPVDAGTAARPAAVIGRWLRLSLLAGLIGGLAVAGLVLARPEGPGIRMARLRLLTFAAGCAAVGAAVGVHDLAGRPGPLGNVLTDTEWGRLWLARTAALGLLATCATALRRTEARERRPGALWAGAAALVAATVTIEAMGGHAGALGSARVLAIAAVALHVLTACLWLGGVAALVVVLWSADDRLDLLRRRGPRFARLAVLSFGLVVATGLYTAGRQVDSAPDLIGTAYGRALLAKLAILVVVVAIALRNATAGIAGRRGTRRVAAEAGAGLLLMFSVGLLAETAPGHPSPPSPAATAPSRQIGAANVADVVVSVSVTPNRPGPNGFTVLAASTRRPPPAPVDRVVLELPAGPVPLRQLEPGRYFGTADVGAAGPVRLRVTIQRAGARLAVPVAWTVAPPAQGEPAPVRPASNTDLRLAPVLTPAAWTVFGLVIVVGFRWLVVPTRRRPDTPAATPVATSREPFG